MKKVLCILLTVLMLLPIVACAETANPAEGLTIAYSIPEMFSTFWKACIYGFEKQCEEYGYEAIVLNPMGDTELQVSQLLNQVTVGADAIVCSPIDKTTIGTTVNEINAAGIPFFCIDRRGDGDVISTLETDNYYAGQKVAEAMIADYGESFKCLIIRGVLSDFPSIERHRGAVDKLSEYPGIEIVGDPSAGEYSEEAAMAVTKNYLESNPDIDCIFLITDALLKGSYAAITEAGYTGVRGEENHMGLYSVDGEGYVIDMIRAGQVDGCFSQYPIDFGADVVTCIKEHYEGKELEETIYYYGDMVTCDNVDTFEEGTLWGDIVR